LPSSSTYLLPLMRRPSDSGGPPHPSLIGRLVLASGLLRPSPSATSSSRSCTRTKGERGHPCGLQDTLCTLRPSLVRGYLSNCSAMDATLDTGGWLALTRQGLSPGKHRQASLGATTLKLSRRLAVAKRRQVGRLERLVGQ